MNMSINIKNDINNIELIKSKLTNTWNDIEKEILNKIDEAWNDKSKESYVLSLKDIKNEINKITENMDEMMMILNDKIKKGDTNEN